MKKKVYVIRRLLQYVARYKGQLLVVAGLGLTSVLFEVAKPLPLKYVVDNVLSGKPLPAYLSGLTGEAVAGDKHKLLYFLVGLMAFVSAGSFVLSLVIFNRTVRLAQGLVFDLMVDFYHKLQRLSLSFYLKNKVGDLLQRMSGDVFVVYFLVAQIILPVLTSLLCLGAMFYIMLRIDVVLAIVAFSVVPVLTGLLALFAKPMSDTTNAQYKTMGLFSAFVQQSLSSMKIIQAFGRESFMQQKLREHAAEFSRAYIVANKVSMAYNQLTVLITGLASAILVVLGALRGLNGTISTGDLFIFLGYITALYGPVNLLTTAIGSTIMVAARGKRIVDILDSEEVVKEKPHALSLQNVRGSVEFRNVTFGYDRINHPGAPVLKNICFKAEAGEVVALVGATGSGKTSLISLLSRFYDPWQGTILLDGVDVADLKLHSLRESISLVLQEPFIFPMSVAENIAFGNPEASFDEIVEAAKGAQAHSFISKLPDGYNTLVSETGSSLSGGERQRIAIARAFLKKAPILIMDEPTSAVDAYTEAQIFKAVAQFAKGKTVFLISHRLSTIRHADKIITIKDGCVVESGTHQSLLQQDKVYAGLYKYQHIT